MRKVQVYVAMSLDGFIARKDGSVDFLKGEDENDNSMDSYTEFIKNIDVVIMGHVTYKQITEEFSVDSWPYKNLTTYVLTHKKIKDKDNIKFRNKSIEALISEIKQSEGSDIWICGGQDVITQSLNKDIIDLFTVTVIPVLIGKGIRLFNGNEEELLSLKETKVFNGMVDLIYKKR